MNLKNNFRKRKFTNNGGITLIALVITIIVLLILAAISISMLSGDNSILNRATQAKNVTGEKQIQEKIRLAVAGAIANGNGSITEDLLKAELNKQFGENGYDLIDKEDDSWDVKVGEVIENVKKSGAITGGGAGENNKLTLTANVRETESRAAVIEVKVAGTPTMLEWLRTFSTEEITEMYARVMTNGNATWAQTMGQSGFSDVKDFYEKTQKSSGRYTDEYDYMVNGTNYVDKEQYNSTYEATFVCNSETITGATAEFVVTKNSSSDTSYTISATQGSNSGSVTANVTKCKVEQYTKTPVTADSGKNSKTVTSKDSQTVEVPAGFYYGDDENVGKVSTGFVITDSVDENGYSNGNEFVWIPIDYNSTAGTLKVKGTEKEIAAKTSGQINGLDNYQGKLYNFSGTTSTEKSSYGQSTNSYREPATLSSYDTDSQSYLSGINLTASQFSTEMQEQYNKFIQSVKTYGGFYVGRYEVGIEGTGSNKKYISKIGVTPTSAYDSDTSMWYGLYSKAKTYTNSKNSVTSGMIWGSQYDAMLNFGLTNSNDSGKITANTNGNHSGKLLKTGTWLGANTTNPETDKINNVFDLEGNLFEWTQEANSTFCRVNRGGNFGFSLSPSDRSNVFPFYTNCNNGSRLGLYIK